MEPGMDPGMEPGMRNPPITPPIFQAYMEGWKKRNKGGEMKDSERLRKVDLRK
jgi:hypothetical protein